MKDFSEISEAQKQKPHELLWMLWFDGKSISTVYIIFAIKYVNTKMSMTTIKNTWGISGGPSTIKYLIAFKHL